MRRIHLHPMAGNVPPRTFQVKFRPFGFDEFRGAHKCIRQKSHGQARNRIAVVVDHVYPEAGQFLGIYAGSFGFGQNVAGFEIRSRVPAGDTRSNRIPKNLSTVSCERLATSLALRPSMLSMNSRMSANVTASMNL